MVELFANSGDLDQMLQNAASDLGLHCLPVTVLGVSSIQWLKPILVWRPPKQNVASDQGLHCLQIDKPFFSRHI